MGNIGTSSQLGDATASTSSLIEHATSNHGIATGDSGEQSSKGLAIELPEEYMDVVDKDTKLRHVKPVATGLVRFNLPEHVNHGETRPRAKIGNIGREHREALVRREEIPGEIVKAAKMLVRIDYTMSQLPNDFNENDSLKIESRVIEKWREFVVVCRKGTTHDSPFLLQMYKTRVIRAVAGDGRKNRFAHEIPLDRKTTKLNMYSSLDKTVIVWRPWKTGTRMYLLRPPSSAVSVEWHTFLRSTLGWLRSNSLTVLVPDLNVTLELENPFEEIELASREGISGNQSAMMKTLEAEKVVASNIILRCMKILKESPMNDVTEEWLSHERVGLAWKRYDRLEWVHGVNEQKMYGTLAMQQTHDLELRPKEHYPTQASKRDTKLTLEEPAPVEGFLIRLTTQKGQSRRLGQNFYKKLYFSTHSQFLCFCNPSNAVPPPGPDFQNHAGDRIPDVKEIVRSIPLIFAINPYPLTDGQISWLKNTTPKTRDDHDQRAFKESERAMNMALESTGYINLCHVETVRHVSREGDLVDETNLEEISRGNFSGALDEVSRHDQPHQTDDRTFELVMKNGLVVRLQSFNRTTKREWMTRLARLIRYWKLRNTEDMNLYKSVRQTNLEKMEIDEEMESIVGQFGEKWEVGRSVASPQLFNMCGVSCCRTITVGSALLEESPADEDRCLAFSTASLVCTRHSRSAVSSFLTGNCSCSKEAYGSIPEGKSPSTTMRGNMSWSSRTRMSTVAL